MTKFRFGGSANSAAETIYMESDYMMHNYEEKIIPIGMVKDLLKTHVVEVESPDGWVPVTDFVDKGQWKRYTLNVNGKAIHCNENHLFETTLGWFAAKDIVAFQNKTATGFHYLCDDGNYHSGFILESDEMIPIVDISVDHPNHRYYTDGVSSHNTGVGKSLAMCHIASSMLSQGRNVLYITMEMAEERIAERIDANLFDVEIQNIVHLTQDEFKGKIHTIKGKTHGRLIIKEYPTASAHTGHFRALIDELRLKKDFKPDVIFIDYLNICASARMRGLGGAINSYSYVKAIAEEIRGLAIECNVPIWSATQVNRDGYGSSDPDLTNTSESFGLPATADLMIALISTEELEGLDQILVKQLKNRYNDPSKHRRFVLGIDRPKMRLYDVEESAQQDIMPEINEFTTKQKASSDFSEFKV